MADLRFRPKTCYLDLEETVIDSFEECNLVNKDFILELLAREQPTRVNIFSFALGEKKDLTKFSETVKPYLERELGIKIHFAWSVQDIRRTVLDRQGVVFTDSEFTSIWGKLRAFQDFCMATEAGCDCFLVDDTVPETTLWHKGLDLIVRTIPAPKYTKVARNGY